VTNGQGRTAIVTGVAMGIGGIGRGIAEALAREGVSLMLADQDPSVNEVAAAMRQRHPRLRVAACTVDLSRREGAARLVAEALQTLGHVDILVNNAGSGVIRPFLEHDEASLEATLARNLWTAIWCTHQVLPHMVARDHGRIVNIGADSLRTGLPMHAGYNAAKGGVVGMMVGLAREFAGHDITINTVSPCVVDTERHRVRLQQDPARAEAFLRVVPKGRGVEVQEIADAVCFLARAETRFITGQDISINGASAMP
jgi:2,3-dihydroxy-2,3-dihydro-p-cumate dehydrogenase